MKKGSSKSTRNSEKTTRRRRKYDEEFKQHGAFADVEQARSETFAYIESYYNRVRRHSALSYLSPEDFERAYYQRAQGRQSLDQ